MNAWSPTGRMAGALVSTVAVSALALATISAPALAAAPTDSQVSEPSLALTASAEPSPAVSPSPVPSASPVAEPATDQREHDAAAVAPAPPAPTTVNALTDVHASAGRVSDGESLQLTADWALPAGTGANAHFGLELPDTLRAAALDPFPLLDAAGQDVGECTVTASGLDCVTDPYVTSHTHIHGDLWVKVSAHHVAGVDHIDVIEAGGATHRIDLKIDEPVAHTSHPHPARTYHAGTAPTKRRRSVSSQRRTIDWEITVPTAAREGHRTLEVRDTWTGDSAAAGTLALAGSVQLKCKADGSGHVSTLGHSAFSVSASSTGLTAAIRDTSCDGTYILDYRTAIQGVTANAGTYTNSATVPGHHPVSATATWTRPASLSKTVKGDNAHRRATWTVTADASGLPTGVARITDHYSDRLTLDQSSVTLECSVLGHTTTVPSADWTTAPSDSGRHTLAVDITDRACRVDGGQYVLTYTTAYPHDAFTGEVYRNSVSLGGVTRTQEVTYTASAGGAASGDGLWSLDLEKDVTGPGEHSVGATEFTVEWSYVADGSTRTGSLHVADGEHGTIARIPAGATVTLTEQSATVAGVQFTAPHYAGSGVTAVGARSAKVTGSSGTVKVSLENPTAPVPVAPAVAPPGFGAPVLVPQQVPTPTPTATPYTVPGLVNAPVLVPQQVPTPTPVATPLAVPQLIVAPSRVPQQVPDMKPTPTPVLVPARVSTPATPGISVPTVSSRTTSTVRLPVPHTVAGRTHLSHTGADSVPLLGLAGVLALAGAGLVVAQRRRGAARD